jgi:GH24 family phage-related lysozyme (muramidase)
MADIEFSAQDKIEEYRRELAAERKTFDTISSDKLEKDLAHKGVESSQIQDQYKIRRRKGFPGFGFERQPQRTLSQILQRQEPPPAFFEGIPQAMQEAIARVNQQIISDEPFVSPNAGRDVETRPLGDDPVNLAVRYGEGTTQQTQAPLGNQRNRVFEEAVAGRTPEDIVAAKNANDPAIQQLENRLGSVAAGEAMLGSGIDYVEQMGSQPSNQTTDAQRMYNQLERLKNKTRLTPEEEQSVRSGDVEGQNVMAAMQGGPEVRAEYMNKRLAVKLEEMDAAGQEPTNKDIARIRTEIMEDVLTNVFREQELIYNQLGVAVDPDTQMFTPVSKTSEKPSPQPLQSGVGQTIVSEANKKDIADFTGVIANLTSSEELSNSQRSALNRLSTELNQRAEMGRPVTEKDLKNLQDDVRYRSAFNVFQNIAEDDPQILENILGGLEVLEGFPFTAPAGKLSGRLAREAIRVSLKETPGKPLRAVVEGVKVRSATPRELKEGIEGVKISIGKKTETKVPVGTRASSRPPNTSFGRKTPIFMIPPADYTPDKIEDVKQIQTKTLNFIIAREGFKPKPYGDVEQTSIGFGTKAEEGQQSITKQEAVEKAQEYLVNNVYPEIDFIQENGTRGLTENQVTAVSSLIYNVGLPKWLNSKSRQLLLDGKFEEFKKEALTGPNAFLTKEPKFLTGLKNRREIEAKLFDTPYVPLG